MNHHSNTNHKSNNSLATLMTGAVVGAGAVLMADKKIRGRFMKRLESFTSSTKDDMHDKSKQAKERVNQMRNKAANKAQKAADQLATK